MRILAASDAELRDAMMAFQGRLAESAREKGQVVRDAAQPVVASEAGVES